GGRVDVVDDVRVAPPGAVPETALRDLIEVDGPLLRTRNLLRLCRNELVIVVQPRDINLAVGTNGQGWAEILSAIAVVVIRGSVHVVTQFAGSLLKRADVHGRVDLPVVPKISLVLDIGEVDGLAAHAVGPRGQLPGLDPGSLLQGRGIPGELV